MPTVNTVRIPAELSYVSLRGLCRAESKVRQGSKSNKRKKLFCFLLLEEKILKCFNFANGNQLELDGESSSMSFAFVVVGLGIMVSHVLSLHATI